VANGYFIAYNKKTRYNGVSRPNKNPPVAGVALLGVDPPCSPSFKETSNE